MNGSALWYLSRGTGVVTLLLLTLGVVLGILETVRWTPRRWPRFAVPVLHRNATLLALGVIAVHVASVVLDGFAPISWQDAVIPFHSAYRPLWLGFGALALDLLIALVATSLLRRHLSYRSWHVVHWFAYLSWPVAVLHGLGTGTDTRVGWVLGLTALCIVAVLATLLWRLRMGWPSFAQTRLAAGLAAVLAPVALVVWLIQGPLHPGWALAAGTPPSLLKGFVATATAAGDGQPATPDPLTPPFQANLLGSVAEAGPGADGLATLRIDVTLNRGRVGRLRILLEGSPSEEGGLVVRRSSLILAGPSNATVYRGQLTSINDGTLLALMRSAGLPDLQLSVNLRLGQGSSVDGTLQAQAASSGSGNGQGE